MVQKFIIIWLSVILLASCKSSSPGVINKLTLMNDTIDLKSINQHDSVYVDFKLFNSNNFDTVRILNVAVSCGCTSIINGEQMILPNSIGIVRVKYKPNINDSGSIIKSIGISTNCSTPLQFFYFKANISK